MIERGAKRVTRMLLKGQIIREDDREIYQYGAEILISTGVNLGLILIIGTVSHAVVAALIYFLLLATVRTQAGGYHASTYFRCGVVYCLTFVGMLAVIRFLIYIRLNLPCLGIGLLIMVFALWRNAPVLHHRQMERSERRLAKKRTGVRGLLWIWAACAIYSFNVKAAYAVFASFLVVVIYFFVGKKWEEKGL